jgi:hypothetical protein
MMSSGLRLAAVGRCVGVRQMLSWHPTEKAKCFTPRPGVADEADFRRGVALLARHGQLLELMLYPYQAQEVARLARVTRSLPNRTISGLSLETYSQRCCGLPCGRFGCGSIINHTADLTDAQRYRAPTFHRPPLSLYDFHLIGRRVRGWDRLVIHLRLPSPKLPAD